jgi:hypothetical protein
MHHIVAAEALKGVEAGKEKVLHLAALRTEEKRLRAAGGAGGGLENEGRAGFGRVGVEPVEVADGGCDPTEAMRSDLE